MIVGTSAPANRLIDLSRICCSWPAYWGAGLFAVVNDYTAWIRGLLLKPLIRVVTEYVFRVYYVYVVSKYVVKFNKEKGSWTFFIIYIRYWFILIQYSVCLYFTIIELPVFFDYVMLRIQYAYLESTV